MDPSFFGLQRHPFDQTADPDQSYVAGSHDALLTELDAGLKAPHGITLLIGDEGAGKTTLARRFAHRAAGSCTVAFLPTTGPGLRHLLNEVIEQLGGSPPPAGDETVLIDSLRALARARAEHDRATVVVVDDAHELPAKTIERLGKLFGEDPAEPTMLHIVLVGRSELLDRMNAASDRSVLKHLVQVCRMDPIGPEDSFRYIADRISKVGGTVERLFSEDALRLIVRRANGIPGRIDAICAAALEQAADRGEMSVGQEAVDLACMGVEGFSLDSPVAEDSAGEGSPYVLGDDDDDATDEGGSPVETSSVGNGEAAAMVSRLREFYNVRRRLVLWAIGLVAVAVGFAATMTKTGELPAPVQVVEKSAVRPAAVKRTAAKQQAETPPVRSAQTATAKSVVATPKLVVRRGAIPAAGAQQQAAAGSPAVTERPGTASVHASPLTPAGVTKPSAPKAEAQQQGAQVMGKVAALPRTIVQGKAPVAVTGGKDATRQGLASAPKAVGAKTQTTTGAAGVAAPVAGAAASAVKPGATTTSKVVAGAASAIPTTAKRAVTPPAPVVVAPSPSTTGKAAPARVAVGTSSSTRSGPTLDKVQQANRVRAASVAAGKVVSLQRRYTVQIGSFQNKGNAEQMLAKLNSRYRDGRIVPADVKGARVYRVLSGSFSTKTDAVGRARVLKEKGFSTFVRSLTD